MHDERIEELLRKGPRLRKPEGLADDIIRDIRLPRVEARPEPAMSTPWFKRWIPEFAAAIVLMGCLAAIGVQTSMIADLRRQNEALRSENANPEALRAENAELKKLDAQSQELERLRKDNSELQTLRSEAAQLAPAAQPIESLRADNQKLQATIKAKVAAATGVSPDAMAQAKAKAERIQCVNNMKQIGLAIRLWADDNHDTLPPDFISMTNELNSPKILYCASDTARTAGSWADVAAGNVSYTFLTPGMSETENPQTVITECPIHHTIGLLDGSVQTMTEQGMSTHLKVVNGRTIFIPNP